MVDKFDGIHILAEVLFDFVELIDHIYDEGCESDEKQP
jgi:hypothetical protein